MTSVTLAQAAKQLNLSQSDAIKAISDAGLDMNNLTPVDLASLVAERGGQQPRKPAKALKSSNTNTSNTPKSTPPKPTRPDETLEELETIDWTDALAEIGVDETTALALVEELEMNPKALTVDDIEALQDLILNDGIQRQLATAAQSVNSARMGLVNESLDMAAAEGEQLGHLQNCTRLQSKLLTRLKGLDQEYALETELHHGFTTVIRGQMQRLGQGQPTPNTEDAPDPNAIIGQLGKQARSRSTVASRTRQNRNSRAGNWLS